MTFELVAPGTDQKVIIELANIDGILKPSNLQSYKVYLFSNYPDVYDLVFSSNPSGDEQSIEVNDDDLGLVEIVVPRSFTELNCGKKYFAIIETSILKDASFDNSIGVFKSEIFELIEIDY